MYTIKKYINDTLSLTNSIVVKISEIPITINKGIFLSHGIHPGENKREWKYYLNLNGRKHFTNNDVKIKLIETNNEEILTKELLDKYSYTRYELNKYSDYYNKLLNNYPNDIDYIKGCINPVDIDVAINAPDGEILAYSKQYVGDNELSVIRELSIRIESMIRRWYVKEYNITDQLHLSSFIGIMYLNIPNLLMNIRLNKVHTNEVHEFHLEHFFRSRYDLWDDISVLNNESIMWLYNNLEYIMSNQGQNHTLHDILKYVYAANNIGVGAYRLIDSLPVKNNSDDVTESGYTKPDNFLEIIDLNNAYNLNDNQNISIKSLVNSELHGDLELDVFIKSDREESIYDYVNAQIKNISTMNQPTKVLDIDTIKLYKMYGNDIYTSIMDQWLYLADNDRYNNRTIFEDPNNSLTYSLTPLEGVYLFYYLLSKIAGKENLKINTISYSTAIDVDINKSHLTHNLFAKDITEPVVDYIMELLPNGLNNINNSQEFEVLINRLITLYKKTWEIDSNVSNSIISANIKHINSRMLVGGKHTISDDVDGVTLSEVLFNRNINIEDNENYNYIKTIETLFKTFTNRDLDDYIKLENKLTSLTNILNKLTSYSTQVVKSVNDEREIQINYNHLSPLYANRGIIEVTDGLITHPLEPFTNTLECNADDFKDTVKNINVKNAGKFLTCIGPTGIMEISQEQHQELIASIYRPNMSVSIIDKKPAMYSPGLDSKANDFDAEHENKGALNISMVNEIENLNQFTIVVDSDEEESFDAQLYVPNISVKIID